PTFEISSVRANRACGEVDCDRSVQIFPISGDGVVRFRELGTCSVRRSLIFTHTPIQVAPRAQNGMISKSPISPRRREVRKLTPGRGVRRRSCASLLVTQDRRYLGTRQGAIVTFFRSVSIIWPDPGCRKFEHVSIRIFKVEAAPSAIPVHLAAFSHGQ